MACPSSGTATTIISRRGSGWSCSCRSARRSSTPTRRASSTATSSPPTTQQPDAPFQNPPPPDPEQVEVTDPSHPLYGRRFQVLSISHPPHGPGHVVVAYRN